MFAVVTCICVGMAYVAESARQRRITTDLGARAEWQFGRPVEVYEFTRRLEDSDMRRLATCHALKSVSLWRQRSITARGLDHLAQLKRLRFLDLTGTRADDTTLQHVSGLHELRSLHLVHCTCITDDGIAHLTSLVNLRELHIESDTGGRQRVTDRALPYIGRLRNLRHLSLTDTQVTDEGLPNLAVLKELEELDLALTRVSDSGLMTLTPLAKLRKLCLIGTEVTDVGARDFHQHSPNCRIVD